jgi:hypothetical protein
MSEMSSDEFSGLTYSTSFYVSEAATPFSPGRAASDVNSKIMYSQAVLFMMAFLAIYVVLTGYATSVVFLITLLPPLASTDLNTHMTQCGG